MIIDRISVAAKCHNKCSSSKRVSESLSNTLQFELSGNSIFKKTHFNIAFSNTETSISNGNFYIIKTKGNLCLPVNDNDKLISIWKTDNDKISTLTGIFTLYFNCDNYDYDHVNSNVRTTTMGKLTYPDCYSICSLIWDNDIFIELFITVHTQK